MSSSRTATVAAIGCSTATARRRQRMPQEMSLPISLMSRSVPPGLDALAVKPALPTASRAKSSARRTRWDMTAYAYNDAGDIVTTVLENGGTIHREYNDHHQITKLTDLNGAVTLYEYDADGNLVRETAPNGGVTTYAYDHKGRLTRRRTRWAMRRAMRCQRPAGQNRGCARQRNGIQL